MQANGVYTLPSDYRWVRLVCYWSVVATDSWPRLALAVCLRPTPLRLLRHERRRGWPAGRPGDEKHAVLSLVRTTDGEHDEKLDDESWEKLTPGAGTSHATFACRSGPAVDACVRL